MTDDRPVLGITLMIAFCALIPFGDALAKLLSDHVPLLQILLARFGLQAALLAPFCARRWRGTMFSPALWRAILWRTLLHVVGIGLMVTSLRFLPLADAVAIAFVMPFILLLLGWWYLGEEVGPRRLIACCVGFCGTMLVVKPAFTEVGLPALLPLLVAVTFAFFILTTRQLSRRIDGLVLQAVSGGLASLLLLPLWVLPILPDTARDMTPLAGEVGWMLLAMGVIGTGAHYLMTLSLRFAPAATLAPMQYLEIPFATLIGWLIWRDLPDGLAALGICVTIGAGVYVVLRERAVARRAAAETARNV